MAKTETVKHRETKTETDLINQAMDARGVSKNSLADQTGIPYKTLCRRLDGDGLLTLIELRKIAAALEIWPSELLSEEFKTIPDAA